ncbi:MAG: circadian clock protein KaiC [bacterium]
MEKRSEKSIEANKLNLVASTVLEKVPTGVSGLDEILHGGLPSGRCTIVAGGPGTGKSILGLEFLAFRAQNNIPGIFVTFEERADALRKNAMTFGIDLGALEKSGGLFIMDARPNPEAVVSGDFDLKGMLAIIGGKAAKMGARQIVFDAIDVLLNLYSDPIRERNEMYMLHNWLLDHEFTSLITVKNEGNSYNQHSYLDFMMDCVILMNARQLEQVTTRRIRVVKYRGSSYSSNEHPFIFKNGLRVIPLSSVLLSRTPTMKHVTTGSKKLDAMLNGGYMKSTSILLAGQSGTGKTTAACMFTKSACERKEKVLYVSYEESQEAIVTNMRSTGIDLTPALKSGILRFLNFMPESRAADEHLVDTIDAIDAFKPAHVVVDAISACGRMGTTQTAFEFVTRLINACKERGSTLILLNQLDRSDESSGDVSGIGISSLIDTALLMQYRRTPEQTQRIIEIVKARGSMHSNKIKDFIITEKGIEIGGKLRGKVKPPAGAGRAASAKKNVKGVRK